MEYFANFFFNVVLFDALYHKSSFRSLCFFSIFFRCVYFCISYMCKLIVCLLRGMGVFKGKWYIRSPVFWSAVKTSTGGFLLCDVS